MYDGAHGNTMDIDSGRRNSDNFDALKSIIIIMWSQNGEDRLAGRTLDCYCGYLGIIVIVFT
jgi:hypothetical protein